MPYIAGEKREKFDHSIEELQHKISDSGELNYVITRLIDNYLGPKISYENLNTILGVLSAVDFEFKRRVVAPYENKKCKKNGDVYIPGL